MASLRALIVLAIITGLSLWGILLWRARQSAMRSHTLCAILKVGIQDSLDHTGKKGFPGFAYYQAHPDELKQTVKTDQRFLDTLPC